MKECHKVLVKTVKNKKRPDVIKTSGLLFICGDRV